MLDAGEVGLVGGRAAVVAAEVVAVVPAAVGVLDVPAGAVVVGAL